MFSSSSSFRGGCGRAKRIEKKIPSHCGNIIIGGKILLKSSPKKRGKKKNSESVDDENSQQSASLAGVAAGGSVQAEARLETPLRQTGLRRRSQTKRHLLTTAAAAAVFLPWATRLE